MLRSPNVLPALAGGLLILLVVGCDDGGSGEPGPDPGEGLGPFRSAESCGECHPLHLADWEASMHAYAGFDPVMRRLTEMADAESGTGERRGNECRACHDPARVRQDRWLAGLPPEVDPLVEDLTADGVNCDVCHSVQIVPPVGDVTFLDDVDPDDPKIAGIEDPVPTPAHASGAETAFVSSVSCAPCHQVNTKSGVGLENTYTEWLETSFAAFGRECQDCHMPPETGQASLGGPARTVHRHFFTGVDHALVPFRDIDRGAQEERVAELLRNSVSVLPHVAPSVTEGETLDLEIEVVNDRTGHSIPSGTSFQREMWLEVTVTDGTGHELLHTGALDADGDLVEDPKLATFGSIARDAAGNRTFFTWRMESIDESGLLEYGAARTAGYPVVVPVGTAGPIRVDMALRFRAYRPAILREIGLPELLPLRVFTMWEATATVAIGTAPAPR